MPYIKGGGNCTVGKGGSTEKGGGWEDGEGDERGEEGSVPHLGDQGGQEEDDAIGFSGIGKA